MHTCKTHTCCMWQYFICAEYACYRSLVSLRLLLVVHTLKQATRWPPPGYSHWGDVRWEKLLILDVWERFSRYFHWQMAWKHLWLAAQWTGTTQGNLKHLLKAEIPMCVKYILRENTGSLEIQKVNFFHCVSKRVGSRPQAPTESSENIKMSKVLHLK